MRGDTGPYLNEDGDVWVPRTVPYLEARQIAKTGFFDFDGDRLTYLGKTQTRLLGFARDCLCEEVCEAAEAGDGEACKVPAWHFRVDER